jgi:uncharacterized membrane protein
MVFPVVMLSFLIGMVAGLRSMMAPAIICAAAYLKWVHLDGTQLVWMNTMTALCLFTLFAIGELIYDKLPIAKARTELTGLITRIVTGSISGAALTLSVGRSPLAGAMFGAAGAIAGTFAGYYVRSGLVRETHLPDFVVAVAEDLLAISGGLFIVSRM